jgi:hypothetical protein
MPAAFRSARGSAVELQPSSVSSWILHSMALWRSISTPLPRPRPTEWPKVRTTSPASFTSFSSQVKVGPLPRSRSSPRSPRLLVAYGRNSDIAREPVYRVYDPRATGLVPGRFTARGVAGPAGR